MKATFSLLGVLLLQITSIFATDVPASKGFINDFTKTLSTEQERELEDRVQEYFKESGIQIGVAIEESLNGKDKFDRAMELSRAWGVGAENDRRGILIYIAKKERKYFITVSNLLQADLNDGIVGEIARRDMVPFLKTDDYISGISNIIEGIINQITSPDLLLTQSKPWYLQDPIYPQTSEGKTTMYILLLLLAVNLYFGFGKNLRSRFILNKRAQELGIEIKPWHKTVK